MKVQETFQLLESDGARALFGKLYGENAVDANVARYRDVVSGFEREFGDQDVLLFSSPGRTEISGRCV